MFDTPFSSLHCCIVYYALQYNNNIFLVYADMTTTEPQGTGRKRGHSDPEGADSEPGKYSYPLVSAALSQPFTNSVDSTMHLCISYHSHPN